MSYAIIRKANNKINAVPLLERHNECQNKNYSNKDIDLSRTSENFHLKKIEAATYQQEFERIRQRYDLKGNLRLSGEKQSNVMCEFVITSDKEFFDRLGAERTKQFFADAYNFVTAKAGENFVISEVVHMDEARRSSSHFEGGNNCTQRRTAKTDRGIDRTTERGSDSEHGTEKISVYVPSLARKVR